MIKSLSVRPGAYFPAKNKTKIKAANFKKKKKPFLSKLDSSINCVLISLILSYNMAMNECIFCQIIKDAIPAERIYEDDEVLAFLDIKPVNLGHTLVIPK